MKTSGYGFTGKIGLFFLMGLIIGLAMLLKTLVVDMPLGAVGVVVSNALQVDVTSIFSLVALVVSIFVAGYIYFFVTTRVNASKPVRGKIELKTAGKIWFWTMLYGIIPLLIVSAILMVIGMMFIGTLLMSFVAGTVDAEALGTSLAVLIVLGLIAFLIGPIIVGWAANKATGRYISFSAKRRRR